MLSKKIVSAAFAALLTPVAFGSLPASTNFDKVDAYADLSAYANASKSQITFYLYGTIGAVKTLLKTMGPYSAGATPAKLVTIESEPGVTYSLEGAVTAGDVLAAPVKAGLVGYDQPLNVTYDLDATASPTALVYNTEVTIADVLAIHSEWNTRVDVQGAKYPDVTYRFYNVITDGANTITALITEHRLTKPPTGGFQIFALSDFGGDHIKVTAEANDVRATGANAISLKHATIGSDPITDNGNTPSAADLAQTAWHINPLTGSNDWDGTAAVHVAGTTVGPIATVAEYVRRTGLNRPIANPVDIYIEADLPMGDPLIITGTVLSAAAYIYVHGSNLTPLHTGTLTGYTAPVAATNTLPIATDALVADWTPYAGKLLRITSGAHSAENAAFWIIKDLGAGNARVSQPCYVDTQTTVASFVPGLQNYEIVAPRLLGGGFVWDVNGAINATGYQPRMDYCEVPSPFGAGPESGSPSGTSFFACIFNVWAGTANSNVMMNVQMKGVAIYQSLTFFQGGYWNGLSCILEGGSITVHTVPLAIRAGTFTTNFLAAAGSFFAKTDIQIADTTNYWNLQGGSILYVAGNIFGTVDAAVMYTVGSGCKLIMTAKTNLRIGGTTFDLKVAGQTSIFPIVVATGLPAGATLLCSLANFVDPATFNGIIHDPITGTQVLTAA